MGRVFTRALREVLHQRTCHMISAAERSTRGFSGGCGLNSEVAALQAVVTRVAARTQTTTWRYAPPLAPSATIADCVEPRLADQRVPVTTGFLAASASRRSKINRSSTPPAKPFGWGFSQGGDSTVRREDGVNLRELHELWTDPCGIDTMAITGAGPSRSPKPVDGDHRNRFIGDRWSGQSGRDHLNRSEAGISSAPCERPAELVVGTVLRGAQEERDADGATVHEEDQRDPSTEVAARAQPLGDRVRTRGRSRHAERRREARARRVRFAASPSPCTITGACGALAI